MPKHGFNLSTAVTPVIPKRILALAALVAAGMTACDKDPSAPNLAAFSLAACPTGNLPANAPITLNFTQAVSPATVSGANVIVTNATTGFEIPGGLALAGNGQQIVFTPSAPLPFGETLSIRVQNLLSVDGTIPLSVRVCNVQTEAAPITEVFWNELPRATGGILTGASMFMPDSGWVAATQVPLYRRVADRWEVRFNQPYFSASYDVDFVSAQHGWGSHFDTRNSRGVITHSNDGGLTFDTVFTIPAQLITRMRVDSVRTGNKLFGIGGGGSFSQATFYKLNPSNDTWRVTKTFSGPANSTGFSSIADIDYVGTDTTKVVAVSRGVRINGSTIIFIPGRVYQSTDAGENWAEIPGTAADSGKVVSYIGVARRANGDVFVTGGNGFLGRIANGSTTMTRINLGIPTRDSTDYQALIYNDVQFAPDDDNIGWVVGSYVTQVQSGEPRRIGLIFETRDGGATWTRQGVRGADDYGATFPALTRLEVYSKSAVWAVGDGGVVLSFHP